MHVDCNIQNADWPKGRRDSHHSDVRRAPIRTFFSLIKSGFNPNQPRADNGRWVRMDVIAEAAGDDRLAEDLRQVVTNPAERSKLESALAGFHGTLVGESGAWVDAKQILTDSFMPRTGLGAEDHRQRSTELRAAVRKLIEEEPESLATVHAAPDVYDVLDNIGWEESDLASIVGAPDSAAVHVELTGEGLYIEVFDESIKKMRRTLRPRQEFKQIQSASEATELVIVNEEFEIADGLGSQGVGLGVFSRQVAHANRMGVSSIQTMAARDDHGGLVGYWVWPRMGYDSPIESLGYRVRNKLQAEHPQAKTVLDVMATQSGREWWKKNGSVVTEAVFDLDEKSRSMKTLAAYRLTKQRIAQGVDKWTTGE